MRGAHGRLAAALPDDDIRAIPSRFARDGTVQDVQRRHRHSHLPSWLGILWALALVGLFLLPSDFRAGSESIHGHSLVHLLIDAADGRIDHRHADNDGLRPVAVLDWLDPSVQDPAASDVRSAGSIDVGEHQESTSVSSGVHLLLVPLMLVPALVGPRQRAIVPGVRLTGRSPLVLLPPPRWTRIAT